MLNKVLLMGRLTKDVELRQTQSGISVCRFSIAVERKYAKQGEERKTDFIDCVAWRQQAEFINKYFHKGNMICIVGSLRQNVWEDNTGSKRYSYDVFVDEANFTGEKATNTSSSGEYRQSGGYNTKSNDNFREDDGFMPVTDDDLPF